MAQNEDGWNKSENVTNPDWDFSVNPIIEGTYVQMKSITIAARIAKLVVMRVLTQQGLIDFGVWLNKVLEGKFEDPGLRPGYIVKIQFLGMAKPKNGGSAYKNFDMWWKPQQVDISINQQTPVQFNQQQEMPPINMNELPSYASGLPYQPPVQNQPVYQPPVPVYQPPVAPINPTPVYQPPVIQQSPPPPPPVQNIQPANNFQNIPVQQQQQLQTDPRFPNLPPAPAGYKYNEQGQLVQSIPF